MNLHDEPEEDPPPAEDPERTRLPEEDPERTWPGALSGRVGTGRDGEGDVSLEDP